MDLAAALGLPPHRDGESATSDPAGVDAPDGPSDGTDDPSGDPGRSLVSLVGAGGKKTAAARLVETGADRGLRTCYTTTVHTPPVAATGPVAVVSPADLPAGLPDSSPVAVARERVSDPARADEKYRGYDPAVVDDLFAAGAVDRLAVKADGARRREFKAPGDGEPRVPDRSTAVVPVGSALAIDRPVDPERIHRPDRVRAVADLAPGDPLTPAAAGRVLASPDGGYGDAPDGARVVPLVNKADTPALRRRAREAVASAVDRSPRIDRGVVASLRTGYLRVVEG